jgi:hypothetical protein
LSAEYPVQFTISFGDPRRNEARTQKFLALLGMTKVDGGFVRNLCLEEIAPA